MYEGYWQLNSNPFDESPDPRFYFAAESHEAARRKLRFAIERGKPAAVLIGASGAGKTFLLRMLAHEQSPPAGPVVQVAFPWMAPDELLNYIVSRLGREGNVDGGGLDQTIRGFERSLTALANQGRFPVIAIDDAQLIRREDTVQALRLLLNLHVRDRVAFTLLLTGTPELAGRLEQFPDFVERIGATAVLEPLDEAETAAYVETRLQIAGGRSDLFDAAALREIYELSGGIPRRINRICDLALLVGAADRLSRVDAAHVEAVSEDMLLPLPAASSAGTSFRATADAASGVTSARTVDSHHERPLSRPLPQ